MDNSQNIPSISQRKLPTVLLIIFFSTIFLVIGVALGRFLFSPTSPASVSAVPTPVVSVPSTIPTVDPTANWKTYKNEIGNFEIKLPAEWTASESTQITDIYEIKLSSTEKRWEGKSMQLTKGYQVPPNIRITILNNPQNLTVKEFINAEYQKRVEESKKNNTAPPVANLAESKNAKEVIINGTSGFASTFFGGDRAGYVVYFPNTTNKKIISVTFDYSNPNNPWHDQDFKLYNQILSTFKFTEKESIGEAKQALITYFDLLNEGKYSEAVRYHGSGYKYLIDWNADIPKEDYALLLETSCKRQVKCYKVLKITKEEAASPREFKFLVQFQNNDGSLFKRGPCCGATEAEMPIQTEFEFLVKKINGDYKIMTQLIYVP